jgi:uncharacterized protein YjdB
MHKKSRSAARATSARWTLAVLIAATSCVGDTATLTSPASVEAESTLRAGVGSVTIDPTTITATVGDSGGFAATVRDTRGRVITGAAVSWSSTDTTVVRIRPDGFATAVGVGSVQVRATSGGRTGQSQVTVLGAPVAQVVVSPSSASGSVGDSAQFSATLYDASGNVLTDRTVTWASSNDAAVTVTATGMARAVGPGAATLTATAEGQSGTASTSVIGAEPPPPPAPPTPPSPPATTVASVSVNPGSASGAVGDSAQFIATARDANGNELTGRTVSWSTTNSSVVVVSAGGMGRAVGPGTAALVATIDGVTGNSAITVTGTITPPPPPAPAAVASVSIAPTSVSVNVLGTAQLSATLRDASGNILTGRSVTWSSGNGLVAGVSSNGTVTGLVAGSTTIRATSEGVDGTATANVTLLPPPPPPSGGSWPNMPSTYSLLTDQGFDPLSLSNWYLIWNDAGNGTITDNSTAPYSGPSVFQVRYPAGFAAGSAPATQVYVLGGKRNVYVGMWWKANANWQGHESNVNKLQFLFPSNGGGDMYMVAYGPPGGPYELRTCLQFTSGDTRAWLRPNTSSGVVTMGGWHQIEWQVEYNTPGSANGVVRWWLDGQLVGDYRDVTFPSTGFEEYKLSPTWGGVGGTKTQTDYFWFDHVTISSK